jgi:drug/metabolite transporter (DMT)-like permease
LKNGSSFRSNLFTIIACLLWSTAFAGVKIGLKYSTPLAFAGTRFMIAGLLLIPFCGGFSNYVHLIRNRLKTVILVSLFHTVILYGLFYIGMDMIPGALGAVVIGFYPISALLITHFFAQGDKINRRKIFILFLGIAGLVIIGIGRNPLTKAGFTEIIGMLIILAGTVVSVFSDIIVSRQKSDVHPVALTSLQIFSGGLILFLISLFAEKGGGVPPAREYYIALVWLSFLSAAAFSLWYTALKDKGSKVSELNFWKFIIPALGALWSWLLIPEEHPEPLVIIGMVIVSLSISILFLPNRSSSGT